MPTLSGHAARVAPQWVYASVLVCASMPDARTMRFASQAWVGLTGRRFGRLPFAADAFARPLAAMTVNDPGDATLAVLRLTRMPQIEPDKAWIDYALGSIDLHRPIDVRDHGWGGFSLFGDLRNPYAPDQVTGG